MGSVSQLNKVDEDDGRDILHTPKPVETSRDRITFSFTFNSACTDLATLNALHTACAPAQIHGFTL